MTSQSSTPGKITIARLVVVFGAIIVAANLFVAWQNNATIAQVKVGGPAFSQIAAGKDFVADILPPPLFPVEAFAVAQMINDHPALLAEKKPVIEVLRTQYAERLAYWQKEIDANGLMTAEQKQVFEKGFAEDGQKFWDEMYKTFLPAVERGDSAASEQSIQRLTQGYLAFRSLIDGTLPKVFESITNIQTESIGNADQAKSISLYLSVLIAAFIAGLLLASYFFIVRPIVRMTECIGQLATGNLDVAVPFASRGDELGVMAKSVEVFKQNGLETIRLRQQQEEDKRKAEVAQRQAEAAAIAGERQTVSESIGTGLMRLAAKDLTYRVSNMPEAYHKLQEDFNSALDQLEEAIQAVAGNTDTINSGTQEISSASDDLSRRTETQAANIEETAAAVAEITATVRKTAAGRGAGPRGRGRGHGRGHQEQRGGAQGHRRHERHREVVPADQPDHRGDRRDRLPDQPAGPERRGGGGARRRCRPRFCGGRLGSAGAGPAFGGSGQGDQGAAADLAQPGGAGREAGGRDGHLAGPDRRAGGPGQHGGDARSPPMPRPRRQACRRSTRRSARWTR